MNQQLIGSVSEALETFIELKKQNTLIMAWIQLRKCIKTYDMHNQPSRPHDHQHHFHIKSGVSEHYNHERGYNSSQSNSSASPRYQNYQRLATDYANRQTNQAMFETFNQNGTTKWQTLHHNQPSNLRSHNQIGVTVQTNADMEDSDQFEDIVLDRLSKLEDSVNEMMRQKRIKEEIRGYVGAPIQPPHVPKLQSFSEDEHLPSYVQPPSGRSEEANHHVTHHITPQKQHIKEYQFWQTSPVTKVKKQQDLKNMKYIPLPDTKQTPVNINKIRTMLKQKSHKASSVASNHVKEEQDLIQGVGYFNNIDLKLVNRGQKSNSNSSFEHPHHHYDKLKDHFKYATRQQPATKQKLSAQIHNKYGYSNTTKNKVTPLQFFSKNLEMQSVIEPGAKFVRSPRSNRNNINYTASNSQVKPKQPNNFFKARNSGNSSFSGQSYFSTPAWRPNIASFY